MVNSLNAPKSKAVPRFVCWSMISAPESPCRQKLPLLSRIKIWFWNLSCPIRYSTRRSAEVSKTLPVVRCGRSPHFLHAHFDFRRDGLVACQRPNLINSRVDAITVEDFGDSTIHGIGSALSKGDQTGQLSNLVEG